MRWICLGGLAMLTAALLVLAAETAVAQQPGAPVVLEEPPGGVPTPAKHRPAAEANVTVVAAKGKPANNQLKVKPADESLSPTPDPQEGPPVSLVAASFKGVTPGTSTKADVAAAWGAAEGHQAQRRPGRNSMRSSRSSGWR